MPLPDLRTIARALGGEVAGRQVLAPGPGHSRKDRSLSVRLSDQSPTGFITYSHAGDDFAVCRDYVIERLGMPADAWRTQGRLEASPRFRAPLAASVQPVSRPDPDDAAKMTRAVTIWNEAKPATDTVVERYLVGRKVALPGADAVRFHPSCPWRDKATGELLRVPAMVAAMRQIGDDTLTGVHRTRLGSDATKLGRMMLGRASGAAIKLDADDEVTLGLHVAEGIEIALASRQFGFRPAWALGSAGAIAAFPVLSGIETLTLLAENDDANRRAVDACASRWHRAGREVIVVEPSHGNDLNDVLRSAA